MNCHEIHPMLHAYVDSELDLMPSLGREVVRELGRIGVGKIET